MKLIDRYLLGQVIPLFFITLASLSAVLSLVEMFSHIYLIVDRQMPVSEMFIMYSLYLPQAFGYAVPVSLLFSVCFVMARLYTRNELIAVLNAGISFTRFTRTLILIGLLTSIIALAIQEQITIPANNRRSDMISVLSGRPVTLDNRKIALWDRTYTTLYYVDRYQHQQRRIQDVSVIIFEDGSPVQRIDAREGTYDQDTGLWNFIDVRIFDTQPGGDIVMRSASTYSNPVINEPPGSFTRQHNTIDSMQLEEAFDYLDRMSYINPQIYREAKTDLYERLIFAFTPLIVAILSASVGTRMKKNILLMTIFFSLGISVVYYIAEFILLIFARQGYIPPIWGSLLPFLIFFIIALYMYRQART